jgi:hypothetical protein
MKFSKILREAFGRDQGYPMQKRGDFICLFSPIFSGKHKKSSLIILISGNLCVSLSYQKKKNNTGQRYEKADI